MGATVVRTVNLEDNGVCRADLCTTVAGKAVIAKAVQGTSIKLTSGGADAGTGDVTIAFDPTVTTAFTAAQTIIIQDAETGGSSTPALTIGHNSTGTPGTGLGPAIKFQAETLGGNDVEAGRICTGWSVVTAGAQVAYMDFMLANAGGATSKMRLSGVGGLSVNRTADPGAGWVDANTGFKIAGTSIFPVTTANAGVPAGGSTGQILVKTAAFDYNLAWKTPTATVTGPSAATAGTTSTTGVMAGLAASFTPATTGRVLIIISGVLFSSVAGASTTVGNPRYGTGTAPAHGAALTGTTTSGSQATGTSSTAGYLLPFCVSTVATGLTVGTAYWIDAAYLSSSGTSTAKLQSVGVTATEF